MSVDTTADPPFCGCPGCRDSASAVIKHPDHGQMVVCEEHSEDYMVIRDV